MILKCSSCLSVRLWSSVRTRASRRRVSWMGSRKVTERKLRRKAGNCSATSTRSPMLLSKTRPQSPSTGRTTWGWWAHEWSWFHLKTTCLTSWKLTLVWTDVWGFYSHQGFFPFPFFFSGIANGFKGRVSVLRSSCWWLFSADSGRPPLPVQRRGPCLSGAQHQQQLPWTHQVWTG